MYNARACGLALAEGAAAARARPTARRIGPPLGGAVAAALVHWWRRRWDSRAPAARLAPALARRARRSGGPARGAQLHIAGAVPQHGRLLDCVLLRRGQPPLRRRRDSAMAKVTAGARRHGARTLRARCSTPRSIPRSLRVINVARPAGSRRRLLALSGSSAAGYWGSLAYLVGAVLFNVDCGAAALAARDKVVAVGVEWSRPRRLGALRRRRDDRGSTTATRARRTPCGGCALYFVGSLSFLVASIAGLALSGGGGGGGGTGVRLPFAVARPPSSGAWVALRMWKREQFGLGFIREINSLPPQTPPRRRARSSAPPPPLPAAVGLAARAVGLPAARRARRSTSARSPPPPSTTPSAPPRRRRRRDCNVGVFVRHRPRDPAARDRRVRTPPKAPYSYLLALMKLLALLCLGCAVLRWVAAFVWYAITLPGLTAPSSPCTP